MRREATFLCLADHPGRYIHVYLESIYASAWVFKSFLIGCCQSGYSSIKKT